jgi:polysaccharide deacetylase 2 family uncharacterized protein YibQ
MLKKYLVFTLAIVVVAWCAIAGIIKGAEIATRRVPPPEPFDKKKATITIAIVIDDVGYSLKNIPLIYGIKKPLTLSVLPHTPYATEVAVESTRHGYEVMAHVPLEPRGNDEPLEPSTIYIDMAEDTIRKKLDEALVSVPGSRGISNHMGSKATESEAFMSIIFNELKMRRLYFLDTMVTSRSTCRQLARRSGIAFAVRDVYLDNKIDAEYIEGQLDSLLEEAKRNGSSIGVCHDRTLTIQILAREMPRIEQEGVEFVFVSDLARKVQ